MSAGEQGPQRGKREASHAASVAQKLACMLALAAACDARTDAPPVDPDDLDGDGVGNEQDLCPLAAEPMQHDEDGDRIGDACDVCPTVADPQQRDRGELDALAFEDGVGDACDPRPSRGGDKIGALHTFATDTTAAWLGAGWTIGDDRARASASTGAVARWQHKRAAQGDGMFARLAVESLVFATAGAMVSVALDGDGVQRGRSCTVHADRNNDGNDELEVREVGGAVAVRRLDGELAAPFELIAMRNIDRLGGGVVVCRLARTRAEMVEASIVTDDLTSGEFAFAAQGSDVAVSSLVVYKTPLSCPTSARRACDVPDAPSTSESFGSGAIRPGSAEGLGSGGEAW